MTLRQRKAPRTVLRVAALIALAMLPVTRIVQAQSGLLHSPGILRNSVTNLHAEGSTLWVGPFLNVTRDEGNSWFVADNDVFEGLQVRLYSLDVEGDVIWGGLGESQAQELNSETQSVPLARGFTFSTDGGKTWRYRTHQAPLDDDPATTGILDLPEDETTTYGSQELPTLPATVPELSPPWDLDYDPLTGHLWSANQVAGLRRSTDDGATWQRIVLPPDTSRYLSPDLGYTFPFYSQPAGIAIEDFHGLNFQVYAVLVDAAGRIWAGSPAGLNRSLDGGLSWYRLDVSDGMPGNWVISIEEQHIPDAEPNIWATTWRGRVTDIAPQFFGAVVTSDGGESFRAVLHGERVYDFAFDDRRVYIAGDNGLFISEDLGFTFRTVRQFFDADRPGRTLRPSSEIYSVAATDGALWVGTADGLLRSYDGGDTWTIFRTEVPVNPSGLPSIIPPEWVPSVSSYAYPNPFNPPVHRLVRLRYRLEQDAPVTIRVFDFGMNLVRHLTDERQRAGEWEASWDGIDDGGGRVANGTYFYAVQTNRDTFWGKILVVQ